MFRRFSAIVALAAMLTGCQQQSAFGDANSIIVGAPNEFWDQVADNVVESLEGRVFTVADEKTFTVTQVDPREQDWINLQKFKQILLIGSPNQPWVSTALEEADGDMQPMVPGITQVHDVWARGQLVTIALLEEDANPTDVEGLLGELAELYDGQFRDYVVRRMFVSGADSVLADSLQRTAGFRLLIPNVYKWRAQDSTYLFRNDNPDPSQLVRQIAVTWKSPIREEDAPEDLLAWRQEIVDEYYVEKQVANLDRVDGGPGGFGGRNAYQIQAAWESPPGRVPAGGPFILRALLCPEQDRMYLMDAWLYAPGKEKYEYMIQLETIMDSFRCSESG